MWGWKQIEYYCETVELLNPKANPPQEKIFGGHFFPTARYFLVGWDWFYIGNRLQETQTQPNQILRKQPHDDNDVLPLAHFPEYSPW